MSQKRLLALLDIRRTPLLLFVFFLHERYVDDCKWDEFRELEGTRRRREICFCREKIWLK
jgi:hypothetical protein